MPTRNPTRNGYTFGGWYTAKDGKGKKLESRTTQLGEVVSGTSSTSTWTFYAYWIPNRSSGSGMVVGSAGEATVLSTLSVESAIILSDDERTATSASSPTHMTQSFAAASTPSVVSAAMVIAGLQSTTNQDSTPALAGAGVASVVGETTTSQTRGLALNSSVDGMTNAQSSIDPSHAASSDALIDDQIAVLGRRRE